MRLAAAFLITLSTLSIGPPATSPCRADAPDVAGAWKLVLMQFGEDDFLIFEARPADGKLTGQVVNANAMLGPIKTVDGTIRGDQIAVVFPGQGDPLSFKGTLGPDGKTAKGSVKFRGTTYPGRIERTEAKVVGQLVNSPLQQKIAQTQTIKDPKVRISKITELMGENPGHPMNAPGYAQILALADAAGMSSEDVAKLLRKWTDESKPFGPEFTADVQSRALKALQGKKPYAALATEMAQAAEANLPADASLEVRGNITNMLARSARLSGNEPLALAAETKAKVIDAKLDAEYHEKVPPFKPAAFEGRKDGKGSRVVLMEIFTGAECPPCVAADVAFDALLKTFQPAEFIGLQHHLHIPGPDPLTNTDTVARQGYYGTEVRGTPSTFFNGKSDSGGGGGMANSENKYQEYRKVIDPALAEEKQADIKLTATRTSDEIKIVASTTATGGGNTARPKLRLVLVEESVRYPGGNKLRFHNNVVRAFPRRRRG